MYVESAVLTFRIPGANSLKDKRQVSKSIIDKVRKRFNISIAEVDTHDIHQILTIGLAVVSGDTSHAQQSLNAVIRYMEEHISAELTCANLN